MSDRPMGGPLTCRRTPRIIDRLLDDGLTAEDRQHVDACPACALGLARARRFEIALGRSAGDLVEEPLPRSALDAPPVGARPARAPTPAFLVAAVAVVALAVIVTLSALNLGRNVGSRSAAPEPLAASLAVPGMTMDATQRALLAAGLACEPNAKDVAGLSCSGRDQRTGATLYAGVSQAGRDGVATLKATMSVPEPRDPRAKRPQVGTEQMGAGASDDAFLAFFTPLSRLPWVDDPDADTGELDGFVKRTIGGANGSCQCTRRIGEVQVVLEGAVGWSWDLVISLR